MSKSVVSEQDLNNKCAVIITCHNNWIVMLYLSGGDDNPHVRKARAVAAQRQAASLQSIAAGGLPLNARDRLLTQASRQQTKQHFFTSDLSVNELCLVRQAGYEPLGQVMGSAVCYITPEWYPRDNRQFGFSFALERLPQAFHQAWTLGLGRLRQEATLLGATGVVRVQLRTSTHHWVENVQEQERLEFSVIGTAIRECGKAAPMAGEAGSIPFLSNLSGEDFWSLQQAHYRPLDLVGGYMAYAHMPSRTTQQYLAYGGNQEVRDYTEASYKARRLAMSELEAEAKLLGASGVIGAQTTIKGHIYELVGGEQVVMIFYFSCIGTAIAPQPPSTQVQAPSQDRPRRVVPIVPLKDRH